MLDRSSMNSHYSSFCSTTFDNGTEKSISQSSESSQNDDFVLQREVFIEPRHLELIRGHGDLINQNWRTKERMKTVSVGIVLCLNVGVDPPDIIKPNPHAVIQCWTDPFASAPMKASDTIVNNLIKQYERLQSRPRYKHLVDPTIEDVKKLCTSLRRTSKEERVLFHYNGHGVPKPTLNGEIWVFNRSFTQYIPLSLYDLQQWIGTPSIYVFDCSSAGTIVETFQQFAIQHQKEYEMNMTSLQFSSNKDLNDQQQSNGNKLPSQPKYQNCILLAACDKGEILPLHPDLPADLFTSCLTTPIKTYLVWFLKQTSRKLTPDYTIDFIDQIPGQPNDRKSVLGELHWIFTAVTDTIAWNTLPRELFQRLFRQDSLVASLFRNFLLAQRILRSYDCTPVSSPPIRSTHNHPMWEAWDLAVDHCLSQLFKSEDIKKNSQLYVPSPFFAQQLTAFQVWLKLDSQMKTIPEKLPIVLQVLLSQVHRSRALDLLGNFLNLGSWAVNLALSVGIFPYVLKLLQASARELRPFLVFIWAKILAIDESSQNELIRDNAHRYFMNVLADSNISINYQVMSAFILSVMIRHNPNGQKVVIQNNSNYQFGSIIDIVLNLLMDETYNHSNLRKWLIISLGNVWENNEEIRWLATRNAVYEKLYSSLNDPVPEVRAATVFALGTFINSLSTRNEHANEIDRYIVSTLIQKIHYDSSPLVRKELLVALHWFILIFESNFLPIFRKKAFEEYSFNNVIESSLNQTISPSTTTMKKTQNNSNDQFGNDSGIGFSTDKPQQQSSFTMVYQNLTNSIQNLQVSNKDDDGVLRNYSNNLKFTSREKLLNKLMTMPDILVQRQRTMQSSSLSNDFDGIDLRNFMNLPTNPVSIHSLSNIFERVWYVVELYRCDPSPEISKQAMIIYNDIRTKSFTNLQNNSIENISDNSEPSSPSDRAKYLSNNSPTSIDLYDRSLYNHQRSLNNSLNLEKKHHSGRVSVSAISSPYLPHSKNHVNFINQYTMKRKIFGKDPALRIPEIYGQSNEDDETTKDSSISSIHNSSIQNDESQTCRKPLIQTYFVDWCTNQFSRPCNHYGICCCCCMSNVGSFGSNLNGNIAGNNSPQDTVSEWRIKMIHNQYLKTKSKLLESFDEKSAKNLFKKLKKPRKYRGYFSVFHPFEKYLSMADDSKFSIWKYSDEFETIETFNNYNQPGAKISDLKIINTQSKALLVVACDDSSIKIWRDLFPLTFSEMSIEEFNSNSSNKSFLITPRLSTAFFMFDELAFKSSQGRKRMVLCWNEYKQRFIAGGFSKFIRIWDAYHEKKISDIVIGSDVTTSIETDSNHMICVGCEDGAVRVFDDRIKSNDGRILSFSNRMSPVVSAKFWIDSDPINLISGHQSGELCWYDKRFTTKAVRIESNENITAMDFHNQTDVFACAFGNENSEIQLFSLDTLKGPVIKNRNRKTLNLSFHPLKTKLAIMSSDSTLNIIKLPLRHPECFNL
ncbi:hypothetical protein NH340_JMT02038 [Sarcoptes scabiei]|nr:hypothetical protein NH340_JMT02038 [Sarcoptes scabiei]